MTVMKNFFKFLFWIIGNVLYIFRIPLIIAGVTLVVGIFSIRIMAFMLCIDFGVVIMAMPAVWSGKKLIENIAVMQKGEKFSGTCTGYKFEHWNCGFDVYWVDDNNVKLHRRFDVPMIRFKYPCPVNVYVLNHTANLGIFTIIKDVVLFLGCLLLWICCTGITLNDIYNAFVYG